MTATLAEGLLNQSFPTLEEAYRWANQQIHNPFPVQASRVYCDRFRPPRGKTGRYLKILGVSPKAERICKEIEPNGEWRVEVENPGTTYEAAGILGPQTKTTKMYRFSAWYSRFLPYAFAMMEAEWSFNCLGVDFESVNSYYGTCLGFVYIGQGDGYVEATPENALEKSYYRIVEEDCALWDDIYNASMKVSPPNLPFDEAFRPCTVFVALHKPKLVLDHFDAPSYMLDHVRNVCEELGKPVPAGF